MSDPLTNDQENVWRTLKDEPHIASKWCRWGFHRWTKWQRHSFSNSNYGMFGNSRRYVMECSCVNCGLVRRNKFNMPAENSDWEAKK